MFIFPCSKKRFLVLLSDGSEVLVNVCLTQGLELGMVLGDDCHLQDAGCRELLRNNRDQSITSISVGLKSADKMVDKQLIATWQVQSMKGRSNSTLILMKT